MHDLKAPHSRKKFKIKSKRTRLFYIRFVFKYIIFEEKLITHVDDHRNKYHQLLYLLGQTIYSNQSKEIHNAHLKYYIKIIK